MPGEVATYLKSRFCPKSHQSKKAKELQCVTTYLASESIENSAPKYTDWEACAFLFVTIDILTHNDEICHSGFEGQSVESDRGLVVMVACALQYLHKTGTTDPNMDPPTIKDLTDNFSFNELLKRTMQTRFCSVLCETISDKDALLNFGGSILPFGGMTLFLTFSPTTDDTIRTSLPKKIRIALRSHKAFFYRTGLILTVTSSIAASPAFIFQITLLTLLCLEQADQVPTPTDRPRQVSDVIADIAPQIHAPMLRLLLSTMKEDPAEGTRPLPWLSLTLVLEGHTLTWTSAKNVRTLCPTKYLSLCPGAIVNGEPQPFVVESGAMHIHLCLYLLLSIANPRMYHSALIIFSQGIRPSDLP